MILSIPAQKESTPKVSAGVLLVGLLGIANFLGGCWLLLPPGEGDTIYFWFVKFYGYALLPSLIFFPVSIVLVALWLSHFMAKLWAKAIMLIIGIAISASTSVPAFGTTMFMSTLRIVGRVSQNHHFYYLVKHYDDNVPTYSFCESDVIGFSGRCKYIGWKSDDSDPKLYIDLHTNLISVKSKNPSFIWTNSTPPSCINDLDESSEEEYSIDVGGCTP